MRIFMEKKAPGRYSTVQSLYIKREEGEKGGMLD